MTAIDLFQLFQAQVAAVLVAAGHQRYRRGQVRGRDGWVLTGVSTHWIKIQWVAGAATLWCDETIHAEERRYLPCLRAAGLDATHTVTQRGSYVSVSPAGTFIVQR